MRLIKKKTFFPTYTEPHMPVMGACMGLRKAGLSSKKYHLSNIRNSRREKERERVMKKA